MRAEDQYAIGEKQLATDRSMAALNSVGKLRSDYALVGVGFDVLEPPASDLGHQNASNTRYTAL